jgi:hypothetical protein
MSPHGNCGPPGAEGPGKPCQHLGQKGLVRADGECCLAPCEISPGVFGMETSGQCQPFTQASEVGDPCIVSIYATPAGKYQGAIDAEGYCQLAASEESRRARNEEGDWTGSPSSSLDLPSASGGKLDKQGRLDRYAQIRDAAAARGIWPAAYLLGGIAYAETGLAHCWSEATWACKGPTSPDCGGPVTAGSGDGPCPNEQGGLGMFQFDAGTYAATLKKYGEDVLTLEGNIKHAIDYVLNMVRTSQYIAGVDNEEQAIAWLNAFDINDAAKRDQWVKTVTQYYNGCQPTSKCWQQRYGIYNGSLGKAVSETGIDFWKESKGGSGPDTVSGTQAETKSYWPWIVGGLAASGLIYLLYQQRTSKTSRLARKARLAHVKDCPPSGLPRSPD